jgi:hypothetical protein
MEREAARPIRGVNDMTEKLAFIIFAFIVPTTVLIIAGLVVAVVILIGAILLFRSPGKKKGVNADKSAAAPGWQPQGQQQGMPGGWNQAGTGGAGDNAWGQQQQPGGWGASPQQQPGGWGAQSSAQQQPGGWGASSQQQPGGWGAQSSAQQQPGGWGASSQQQPGGWGSQTPAQQQPANPWGSPSSTQQQPSTWGNANPSTPSGGAGTGGNQPAWDATLAAQQPPASQAQDPWGQPSASSTQQGGPVWGMPGSNPAQQQQAPTSYGGSGSGQAWSQSNQAAPAQQAWGQPPQQQPSSTPSPATGGNQGMPPWQQGSGYGQGQGQAFGSPAMGQDAATVFGSSDNDRTMLRPSSPQGTTGIVRVEEGKEPGRVYEVRKDELSIGRSRESDIFLEDLAVSRLHAKILSMGNGNYALKDEGSANGTKVNGQLVNKYQTYPLQEGDKIQLGQTVLVFARR